MANEIELEQQVIDGEEAKQILESKTFKALDEMMTDFVRSKLVEHCQEPEQLQQIAYRLVAHEQYREWFQTISDTGKIAVMELSEIRDT